eukprot:TRINITY_DN3969_c0_g1_i2.p1 TRINITY_DN3969_c0_g1~~TRINITY_DN3969_c0_g1_i2.p1  ORF type:complete len:202 (-),score=34.81 TRINITY_DN3969_c0_g1_i2:128-733(-)
MVLKTWSWMHPSYCRDGLEFLTGTWFPHHEISLKLNESVVERSHHTQASSLACEDLWNTVSLLMVCANMFTCSIALYAILQFEHAFSERLHPVRPFWKFWGVKGLLSVNFMQRICLMAFGVLTTGNVTMSKEFRTSLNFYLVCVESAVLAALNVCAYSMNAHPNGGDVESPVASSDLHDLADATAEAQLELAEVMGKASLD